MLKCYRQADDSGRSRDDQDSVAGLRLDGEEDPDVEDRFDHGQRRGDGSDAAGDRAPVDDDTADDDPQATTLPAPSGDKPDGVAPDDSPSANDGHAADGRTESTSENAPHPGESDQSGEQAQPAPNKRQQWDGTKAAAAYSQASVVIAGFAVAVVAILLTQQQQVPDASLPLLDRASATFLAATFGLGIGAFVFALSCAEPSQTPRSHGIIMCAACGAAVGIFLVFWGLSVTARVFLPGPEHIAQTTALIGAIALAVVIPLFLSLPYCDLISEFGLAPGSNVRCEPGDYPWRAYGALVGIGLVPVVTGVAVLVLAPNASEWLRDQAFMGLIIGTVVLVAIDTVAAVIWSALDPDTRITPAFATAAVVLHSVVIAAFVAALPTP